MAVVNNKIENIYSLTPLQEGMLFHSMLGADASEYVCQEVYDFEEELNERGIRDAADLIAMRYDVLRTAFAYEKLKKPRQIVLRERSPECVFIDLTKANDNICSLCNKIISDDVKRGFDLVKDTLLRLTVIKMHSNQYRLIFTTHHIIVDGWCTEIIQSKFINYYKKLVSGVTKENIINEIEEEKNSEPRYGEYIKWLESVDKEQAMEYWENELADYDNSCEIKSMSPPNLNYNENEEIIIEVDRQTTSLLKLIAEKNETTINVIAEIAVGIMLQKYCGCNDVVFGKVVSGRNVPINGIEDVVGLFVNTIPLRVKTELNDTVNDLIIKQHEKETESTNYEFCSLAEIQALTNQGGDLIKILYVFENYSSPSVEAEGETDSTIKFVSGRDQTNYGITILGAELAGKLCFKTMFDTRMFRKTEVQMILERLKKICEEMAEKPDCMVVELETVTESEKQLILNDFNATEAEYPRDKTVVELFEEQVKKTPDKTALVFKDTRLTYAELNNKANIIAAKLRAYGIEANDCAAVISDRNADMVTGIMGIVKSGAAYVPIDPTYPEERISYILEDSGAKAIVKNTAEEINIPDGVPVIDLTLNENKESASENLEIVNKPEDLLYCIYTSGTTGKPKGVMQLHRTIVNLICDEYRTMGSETFEKTLFATNCGFDVSVQEYFSTLLCGGTGYIITLDEKQDAESCMKIVDENKITTMFATPSYFDMLSIEETDRLALNIKNAILAGEAFKVSNTLLECEKASDMKMHNHYGPTESHVVTTKQATVAELRESKTLDLGKPVANNKIYILSGDLLCGIGVPGELCITGDGLARGYLNRPELTAEKFVKNPFGEGRMYRTGDLARWLPNGNIEYLGRIDEQVKIRGFRIELGEIESRIREIENIKDCAVIARADSTGNKAIYAYYTSDAEVSVSEVRDRLSESLPEYMVPAYMMQIESIPVTRNGKLDKRALPEIEARATREYVAPRNEIEEAICRAFSEVLSIDKVGVLDSYFELGGDSLKAIRVVSNLNNSGYKATVKDILSGKTPGKIAVTITDENASTLDSDNNISERFVDKVKLLDIFQEDNSERMEKAEAILGDDINKYKKNTKFDEAECNYSPSFMQKYFYTYEANSLIKACYEVADDVSKDELLTALRGVIKEQSILRTCYDLKNHMAYECAYRDDWFIPYYEEENVPELIGYLPALSNSKLLFGSCELQSFIVVIKKKNGKSLVCTYINHGVWDMFSVMILCKRLNAHLKDKSLHEEYRYSEYVSNLLKNKCNNSEAERVYNEYLSKSTELLDLLKNNMKKVAFVDMKLDIPDDKKENFNSRSMEKTFELFLKMNPAISRIEYIPFIILYHGRSDTDDNMAGIKLSILPALYSIKEHKIVGGTSVLNPDKSVPGMFYEESFYDMCYSSESTVYIFNNRGIFDGELGDCSAFDIKKINVDEPEVDDGYFKSASFGYDVIEDFVLISLPVYMNDDTDVKSYVEEKLKDIEELYD